MYYRGLNIQKHLLSPVSQILFQEPAEHWRSHLRMEPTFAAGSYSISMDLSGHHICYQRSQLPLATLLRNLVAKTFWRWEWGWRNNVGSFIYKLELRVHTEPPCEGSCADTLAGGGKTVNWKAVKKYQALLYCPTSREFYRASAVVKNSYCRPRQRTPLVFGKNTCPLNMFSFSLTSVILLYYFVVMQKWNRWSRRRLFSSGTWKKFQLKKIVIQTA